MCCRPAGRSAVALAKLGQLYPEAVFPAATIVIGRGASGGTTSAAGVLIGLETLCNADYLDPNLEDRSVHLIAHEYIHAQQPAAQNDDPHMTVLLASEIEGGAEFGAELISGSVNNIQLPMWTKGRGTAIENAFVVDEDQTDISKLLYNGPGTNLKPGDLGYWVGYRISKAYYRNMIDKQRALREIIQVRDPNKFLSESGWYPGA